MAVKERSNGIGNEPSAVESKIAEVPGVTISKNAIVNVEEVSENVLVSEMDMQGMLGTIAIRTSLA